MQDLLDILKSSGPVSLDELNLRSSNSPEELAAKIENLERRGMVHVTGPHAGSLSSLGPEEIESDADTVVTVTRNAFKPNSR